MREHFVDFDFVGEDRGLGRDVFELDSNMLVVSTLIPGGSGLSLYYIRFLVGSDTLINKTETTFAQSAYEPVFTANA